MTAILRLTSLAGVAVVLSLSAFAARAGDTIKIGAPFNLSGDMSSIDAPALKGAKLKAKEINDAGGVLGKKIELIVYDTKTDAKVIASVAAELIEHDKVQVGLGFTDPESVHAIGTVFEKAGVPFVTPGATAPKLPSEIGDTIFLACFGDNVQAAAGADFIKEKLAGKRAYILLDSTTEYAIVLSRYFKEAFTHGGGEVVGEDVYKNGDKSFTAQIAKIKASAEKPDVLYVAAMPDDIGLVVRELRHGGLAQPIVGGDGYDTPLLVKTGGAAADDVYFSTHAYMAADSTPAIQKFYKDYKAAFGSDPENAFAALGYDTVGLVADAIKRAGADDAKAIRAAIAATSGYVGVTGTISYPNGAHVPAKTVTMLGVKDKRTHLAAEVNPSFIPAP
jgi:branched-chain amino acid transport system substrate-binding protein